MEILKKIQIFREEASRYLGGFLLRMGVWGAAPICVHIGSFNRTSRFRTLDAPGGCHLGHWACSGRKGRPEGGS